jgi:hypothetical protein
MMELRPAAEADFVEIVELANLAYRGTGAAASWNAEDGILEGQRLNESLLRDDLAAKPTDHCWYGVTHRMARCWERRG